MKFVATSDWHLKINRDAPLEWSCNRYSMLFKLIITKCLEQDAWLLLGGDIADSISLKLEELDLLLEFFNLIEENKINTILIAGNHCKLNDEAALFDYLQLNRYKYIRYKSEPVMFHEEKITVYPVNHFEINSYDYSKVSDDYLTIMLGHCRCDIPPHIVEEAPLNEISKNFNLVLLGDIHAAHSPYPNVFYTNAPINSCFELSPNTGFILLDVSNGTYELDRISTYLPALVALQTTVEEFYLDLAAIVDATPDNFYKITVTGQLSDLKKLPNSISNAKIIKAAEQELIYQTEDEPDNAISSAHTTQEEQLLAHMVSLDYSESLIKNMITELRDL